ncbi:MAG: metallophosphoesterase, partial [Bacteroidota bacterium]
RVLFSESSELGRWLRSKNAMIKIGDYLFVHAGLSPKLLNTELDIDAINRLIGKNLENRVLEDTLVRLLIGPESPLWYRGLVEETKRYPLIKETELLALLKKYEASTVVIGHTVVEEVSSSFKGKVITMDVKHSEDEFSEQTQGLLIESGQLFKVNGKGQKEPLKALD